MTKAYHYTGPDPAVVDAVRRDGFLRPPREWAHSRDLVGACTGVIEHLENKGGSPATIDILYSLVEEEAGKLEAKGPGGRRGFFQCHDFLLGDVNSVFFSVGDWPRNLMAGPENGFVFEAEDLVRKGAKVRGHDFLSDYEGALSAVVVREGFSSTAQARSRMAEKIAQLRRDHEAGGAKALAWLASGRAVEVVSDGPVAVKDALEIWKEGALVE